MLQQDEARNPPSREGQAPILKRPALNYIGIGILIAGVGSGELIYWRSLQNTDYSRNDDSLIRLADSRAYDRTIETQVGTFGLIVNQWDRELAKLGEPGPLAITISAFSMLAAGGCFVAASRMPRS